MNDVIIKVENLCKTFKLYNHPKDRLKEALNPFRKKYHNEYHALKEISFEIKRGESVGIIGKNGAGKSTLLKILTGVITPSSGEIKVNGRVAALLELGAGFNPELSGLENIYFQGAVLGLKKEEMVNKIPEIVQFADIGTFIYQPVKTYSSGMFARLAFSVSVFVDPEILIIDEALAVGDMRFQAKCMTKLKQVQETGVTVLFVSHDIGSVRNLCSKAIFLDQGRVRAIGSGPEIAEQYIKALRIEMNSDIMTTEVSKKVDKCDGKQVEHRNDVLVKFDLADKFAKLVEKSRHGSGEASIVYAELLNEDEQTIEEVAFNQAVLIRIYIETKAEVALSPNYYIQDDKKNLILGAGLRLLELPLINAKEGNKLVVTYKTCLPLQEGRYSIQLQLTEPIVANENAKFLDIVEDAIVFKVSKHPIARVWTKVFIPNSVEIKHL